MYILCKEYNEYVDMEKRCAKCPHDECYYKKLLNKQKELSHERRERSESV